MTFTSFGLPVDSHNDTHFRLRKPFMNSNKNTPWKPSNTNNSRLCRRLRGVLVLLPEYGVDV